MCDDPLIRKLPPDPTPDEPPSERLLTVVETFPLPIAVLTRDDHIAVVNRAWQQFAERRCGEIARDRFTGMNIGEACRRLLPPCEARTATAGTDIESLLQKFGDLQACGRPSLDGRVPSHAQISVFPLPSGDGGALVLVHEGCQRKQHGHEAIREVRERLADIVEVSRVGTWEWSLDTGVVRTDERWAAIIGYASAETSPLNEQAWRDLVHPDDREGRDGALKSHLSGERAHYESEYRMLHKQGIWVWVRDRGRLIERSAGSGSP